MDFSLLLEQNTRTDDYVNATKLCKAFDRRLDKFMKSEDTKAFVQVLEVNPQMGGIKSQYSKPGVGTYIHPLLAIKLAEWLSPEFEVYVKTTFKRYLEGDITLATDIIDRTTDNSKLDKVIERAEGKKVRNEFTDVLKARGCEGKGYAQVTDAEYRGLFGVSTKQLKEEKGLATKDNLRNSMSAIELAATRLTELLAMEKMEQVDAKGTSELAKCAYQAGTNVGTAIKVNRTEDLPVYSF